MRCRIVVAVAVVAMMLVSPFVFQGSDAQYTYDSPDGTYAYAKHGSGSESNPYWSEILSFSFEGGTVFLQSSLEGYEVTALTSLSGCRADMVVVPRTVTTVADDVLDGASIGTLVFLGDRPDMRVPDGMTILSLGGTSGWEGVSDGTIPLLTYSNGVTSFTYYVLNGEAYVYGAYGSVVLLR